jgi:hypothetical protein
MMNIFFLFVFLSNQRAPKPKKKKQRKEEDKAREKPILMTPLLTEKEEEVKVYL